MKKPFFPGASSLIQISIILVFCIVITGPVFANVRIWATGCTEKVQYDNRSELPHDRIWDESTKTVKINGVRGEHVPFQIVITADRVNVSGITLEKSELKTGTDIIPPGNIQLYYEHLIKVYAPSGSHGEKGYWPDALVPLTRPFDIRSGVRGRPPEFKQQPVWIDIIVPDSQSPGIYKGAITVSSDEGNLGEINIELTVWDITMPAERHFPTLIRIGPRDVARMHGLDESSPEFKVLYTKYLEHALNSRVDPRYLMSFGLEGRIENENYILEWIDNDIEDFFVEKGLTMYQISAAPPGIAFESGEEPFSELYKHYVSQYITQVIAHAREKGWDDKIGFLCPVDEPRNAEEYEAIRRWASIVKDVDPKVNFMVTEQPLPENPEWGSFAGFANYWIVHGNYLAYDNHVQAIVERQQAGDKVIWYISCDQEYPQPNYFIDREAADSRMVSWITWRYQLGGILYWTSTFWREVKDPWIDPITWKLSGCNDPLSGEGSLIYPGNMAERYTGQENVFGPVSSIRLELLREGLEEIELLYLLKESGGQKAADKIVESICKGVRDFTRDPNEIDEAREKIIWEILKRMK
ncbi:glycoside hydrolase domain-containing protein [Bacteroidota bacterium]